MGAEIQSALSLSSCSPLLYTLQKTPESIPKLNSWKKAVKLDVTVNFMCHFGWLSGAQIKCFLPVFVRVIQMRLAFESVDLVESLLQCVGIIQCLEDLNRTRDGGRKVPLFSCFTAELEHLIPSTLGLHLQRQLPWLSDLRTWTTYISSFPGSPACRGLILGLLSLHKSCEPIPIIVPPP